MRLLILVLITIVGLALPFFARAESKDPLSYPLRQYGFVLGMALLGGLVGWYAKVKKGEAQAWNLSQLIGELSTSAFAGLLCFWLCELAGAPALLGACLVGVAGHMGTRAILAFESFAMQRWGQGAQAPKDPA